eukprot:CAMPEP_0201579068 /NCGR_PEP_ID=MMETSP0190_2-20130828/26336_1 /ASSEMBLY_ACC=CAM_ASM_000263 /TAXON_ID=37353 /ORGANISM="Rosalina sp." /LENGTH=138 /DNA_ID=CAMNT_0048012993 /DNA_START=424 /DNA_END=840 /DNA_ORIENTATION=+
MKPVLLKIDYTKNNASTILTTLNESSTKPTTSNESTITTGTSTNNTETSMYDHLDSNDQISIVISTENMEDAIVENTTSERLNVPVDDTTVTTTNEPSRDNHSTTFTTTNESSSTPGMYYQYIHVSSKDHSLTAIQEL